MGPKMYLTSFCLFMLYLEVQSCPSSSSKPAAAKFQAETDNGVWPVDDISGSSSKKSAGTHHPTGNYAHSEQENSYKLSETPNETGVNGYESGGRNSNNNSDNNKEQPQITASREPHHHHRQHPESISYYQASSPSDHSPSPSAAVAEATDLIESSIISPVPAEPNRQQKQSAGSNNSGIANNNNSSNNRRLLAKSTEGLRLVHFSNKSITCNDGTPAGYYVRKSTVKGNDDNLWIIFLEGGWYCFDQRSCLNRWHRLKHLMTSSGWPNVKIVGGILSSDPDENPYWWNANHVFIPYCSSDTWSGRVRGNEDGNPFSFMGALIIDEVIKNLIRIEGLDEDSSVILAGSSAGGTGVMINLDNVESQLTKEFGPSIQRSTRVRGITDSGWFIDKVPLYSEKVNCQDVILCPPEISLRKGMNLWNARLPDACQDSNPDEPWSCFFGYRIYPTLKASLFVFQWLFDEAQMIVNNVPTPALRKEEWDYVYKVGDELKKTLSNVTNVFIPSCLAHTVLTHRDWRRVEVNSVELTRALKCWESGGITDESNFIHKKKSSQKFWEESEHESSLHSNGPRGLFRHGKVYRSSTAAPFSSSMSSNLSTNSDYSSTVVVSNDSSRRNRRRHNRHRHNKQSSSSSSNNSQNHRQTRRRRKKLEKRQKDFGGGGRSRSGKSSKTEHRQKSVDKLQESISSMKVATSRSNFDSTAESTSPQIRNIQSHSTNNKKKHKKRKRNRRWFSMCDATTGISTRSGNGSPTTEIRLVEKCAWPQCNKSCPKLLNPHTGEEVDFKDLLKSFGLDLAMMAKALGIDLATLNSMDHQVLLQMLTQHA